MGGIQAGATTDTNANELKQVIQRTTKVTKVSRGEDKEKPEDQTHEVTMHEADESEDED